MAVTKKALEIRQQKEALREAIHQVNDQLRLAASVVPRSVRAGSHQAAVEWKDLAEQALQGDTGAKRATHDDLQSLLSKKRTQLVKLSGK